MKRALIVLLLLLAAPASFAAEMILFEHDNFQGRSMTLRGSVPDLGNSGFNDITSSIIVRSGTWRVCEHAHYGGRCITLSPGQYRSMNRFGMNDIISSVRDMGQGYRETRPVPEYPETRPVPPRGEFGRAELFEGGNFTGRNFVLEGSVRDLGDTGFNAGAASLRVYSGTFQFCSEVDFRGTCRTFGPGEYRNLPGMGRVVSGRATGR